MSWYYLWENLHKIGSSKDFLMNFYLLACCFTKGPTGKQKRKNIKKLSTFGSSFDLNVSSQGVNQGKKRV